MPLLQVENLSVSFRTSRGSFRALDGIDFTMEDGESLGLVGKSGCGKTTIARSILRLLPGNAEVSGRILFRGRDILSLNRDDLAKLRWRDVALVTQSAMNALDPVYRVGDQIIEAIRAHQRLTRTAAWARAERLFETVGLKPEWVRRYPHEFSGGMRQRAIIAMAIALNPPLIIADEPTTALDVIIQDQVFAEIDSIRREHRTALVLITHDISLVAENCDRLAIVYAGNIVEMGPTQTILSKPMHPYTIGLQNAYADLDNSSRELISIAGAPPDLLDPPAGCRFAPRCPFAREQCAIAPDLKQREDGHWVRCHFADDAETFRRLGAEEATWEAAAAAAQS